MAKESITIINLLSYLSMLYLSNGFMKIFHYHWSNFDSKYYFDFLKTLLHHNFVPLNYY